MSHDLHVSAIYKHIHMYLYIYIYREREKGGVCICTYIYIYIHTFIHFCLHTYFVALCVVYLSIDVRVRYAMQAGAKR